MGGTRFRGGGRGRGVNGVKGRGCGRWRGGLFWSGSVNGVYGVEGGQAFQEAGVGRALRGAGGRTAGLPGRDRFAAYGEGFGDLVLAQACCLAQALALVGVRERVLGGFLKQRVDRCEEALLFVGHRYLRVQPR